MKKLLISIILIVLLFPIVAQGGGGTILFLPVLSHFRTNGLGLHLSDNHIFLFGEGVWLIRPAFVRIHVGAQILPNQTLYQDFLSGGWTAVDNRILPDLEEAHEMGATPIVTFMYGGVCAVPTNAQLIAYGNFIAQSIVRYELKYTEVWNEPDTNTGFASLFGCFGKTNIAKLNLLLQTVQSQTPPQYLVGASFMVSSQSQFDMLSGVKNNLDWIGVHHYGVWFGDHAEEPWPGTVETLYNLVAPFGKPVLLTEVNLREDNDNCTSEFYQGQLEYIQDALETDFVAKVILVYYPAPDWQCTGIIGTPTDNWLKMGYP